MNLLAAQMRSWEGYLQSVGSLFSVAQVLPSPHGCYASAEVLKVENSAELNAELSAEGVRHRVSPADGMVFKKN